MVLQKAQQIIDHLKERPKDDKKVVAGGIAIVIVATLFFGWAYLFLKKIQNDNQSIDLGSVVQDSSLSDVARQAHQEIQQGFSGFDEVRELRTQLEAQQSGGASMQYNESGNVIPLNQTQ